MTLYLSKYDRIFLLNKTNKNIKMTTEEGKIIVNEALARRLNETLKLLKEEPEKAKLLTSLIVSTPDTCGGRLRIINRRLTLDLILYAISHDEEDYLFNDYGLSQDEVDSALVKTCLYNKLDSIENVEIGHKLKVPEIPEVAC
jgi:hypothetical protein